MNYQKLTKYEQARVIGVRARLLSNGMKTNIETILIDPYKIAVEEAKVGKLGLVVSRTFPNGKKEDIPV